MAQASADAAKQSYKLGEDQLAFEKQQWATDQPIIQRVADASITSQGQQNDFSKTMQGVYTGTFLPLQEDYAQKAKDWGSPAQQTINAGAAQAAVGSQMDASRNSALQQLESFGVDPTNTRYAALDIGTAAQKGAAQAAAGTGAIQSTKLQGMGLEAGAIATGQGNAGAAISATQAATGAGASASGSTLGGLTAGASAMAAPTAWYNAGANNMGQYVNAVNGFNYAQNQAAQINNQSMAGVGQLFGSVLGMFEDGGAVGGEQGIPDPSQMAQQQPQMGAPSMGSPNMGAGPTMGGGVPAHASPTRGAIPDDVPARLTAGEFVVPRDVVMWEGEKNMYGLIDKARQAKQKAGQRPDVGGTPGPAINAPPAFQSQALPV